VQPTCTSVAVGATVTCPVTALARTIRLHRLTTTKYELTIDYLPGPAAVTAPTPRPAPSAA
jgi:hypothetical protein